MWYQLLIYNFFVVLSSCFTKQSEISPGIISLKKYELSVSDLDIQIKKVAPFPDRVYVSDNVSN